MKFLTTSCLLATLSLASALADTAASPTISYLSTTSPTTSATTDSPDLELRQIGLVNPDAALTGVAGGGAVTNYQINSQVGPSAAENVAVVYTQTFAAVPDQWPSAKAGVIGLGDLAKRNVQAEPTVVEEARVLHTGHYMEPVVVEIATEVVTVPVRRVTSVVVVETVTVRSFSSAANGTALGSNGTVAASMGFETGTRWPLHTATGR